MQRIPRIAHKELIEVIMKVSESSAVPHCVGSITKTKVRGLLALLKHADVLRTQDTEPNSPVLLVLDENIANFTQLRLQHDNFLNSFCTQNRIAVSNAMWRKIAWNMKISDEEAAKRCYEIRAFMSEMSKYLFGSSSADESTVPRASAAYDAQRQMPLGNHHQPQSQPQDQLRAASLSMRHRTKGSLTLESIGGGGGGGSSGSMLRTHQTPHQTPQSMTSTAMQQVRRVQDTTTLTSRNEMSMGLQQHQLHADGGDLMTKPTAPPGFAFSSSRADRGMSAREDDSIPMTMTMTMSGRGLSYRDVPPPLLGESDGRSPHNQFSQLRFMHSSADTATEDLLLQSSPEDCMMMRSMQRLSMSSDSSAIAGLLSRPVQQSTSSTWDQTPFADFACDSSASASASASLADGHDDASYRGWYPSSTTSTSSSSSCSEGNSSISTRSRRFSDASGPLSMSGNLLDSFALTSPQSIDVTVSLPHHHLHPHQPQHHDFNGVGMHLHPQPEEGEVVDEHEHQDEHHEHEHADVEELIDSSDSHADV